MSPSVVTVASAAPVPSALNIVTWNRTAPITSAMPTMPLQVIITAAKTVSRARDSLPGFPEIISVTIERDLDDRHSDCQHKGSVRLTDSMRNDFGVIHRGQDGPCECHCNNDLDDDAGFATPRQCEQDDCQHGDNHGP